MANLRLFRPRLYKFSLFIIFLFMTGLPQFVWNAIYKDATRPEMAIEERFRVMKVYGDYLNDRILLAKKKILATGSYRPRDYFWDLRAADEMKNKLGITSDGLFSPQLTTLKELMVLRTPADFQELEAAKSEYKDFIDPAREPREEFFSHVRQQGWCGVTNWLFVLYLRFMPLAFVLFVVWALENAERLRFPKPGRLVLLTLVYPLVIARVLLKWLKKEGRDLLAEAELRRTKQRLFTYLSENEIRKIREFGASMLPLNFWRKRLAGLGLKPRHSLAAALVVTLIFALLPAFVQAGTKAKKQNGPATIVQLSEQHLARMDLGGDKDSPEQAPSKVQAAIQATCFLVLLLRAFFRMSEAIIRMDPLCRKIDHIPLSVIRFWNPVLQIQTE